MKITVVGSDISGLAATWVRSCYNNCCDLTIANLQCLQDLFQALNEHNPREVHLYEVEDCARGHAIQVGTQLTWRRKRTLVGWTPVNPLSYVLVNSFSHISQCMINHLCHTKIASTQPHLVICPAHFRNVHSSN